LNDNVTKILDRKKKFREQLQVIEQAIMTEEMEDNQLRQQYGQACNWPTSNALN